MNTSIDINEGQVSGVVTISVDKEDYAADLQKQLKAARQQASMPGFRKGKVPMGLINKMYRGRVLSDILNKLMDEKLNEVLNESDKQVLGQPLMSETMEPLDLDKGENFTMKFDVMFAPEFEVSVDKRNSVDYYTIEVSDEMVDAQIAGYTQRNGEYKQVDDYQDRDMLKGTIAQLDAEGNVLEGGIQVEDAVLMPAYMKSDDQKALFEGTKVNDVIVFNPNTAYDGAEAEVATLLKVDRENAGMYTGDFSFQVNEITRFVAGELNQEIFDEVLGEGVVSSEEEFRAHVKGQVAEGMITQQDYKFLMDARTLLEKRAGDMSFDMDLVKRVIETNDKDNTIENIEEAVEENIKSLKWELIKNKLAESFEIKLEQEDIDTAAVENVRMQLAQYGMPNAPEDLAKQYAAQMMQDEKQRTMIVNSAFDKKLATALKDKVKLNEKTVSVEDFNKLFENA